MFRSVGQGMKPTYLYLWYPLRNTLLADKNTLYYQEIFLHGYMNNTRTINTYFIKFLISVVRLTIYKSTQIMMFDNKEIDINYFYLQCTSIIEYAFIYYKVNNRLPLFIKYFDVHNPLIRFQNDSV